MRTAWPIYVGLKRQSRLAPLTNTLEQRRLFELSVLMLAGFLAALLTAFVPTAIVGLLLHRWVKANLFGPMPVAGALAVGGVLMIAKTVGVTGEVFYRRNRLIVENDFVEDNFETDLFGLRFGISAFVF